MKQKKGKLTETVKRFAALLALGTAILVCTGTQAKADIKEKDPGSETADTRTRIDEVVFSSSDLPASIKVGDTVPGWKEIDATCTDKRVDSCFFQGFFKDKSGNTDTRASEFENNHTYYAEFDLYFDRDLYIVDDQTKVFLTVGDKKEELVVVEDKMSPFSALLRAYKAFTIGTPVTHKLTFNVQGKNFLPDWAKNGILFEDGENANSALSYKQREELLNLHLEEAGKYYEIYWYMTADYDEEKRLRLANDFYKLKLEEKTGNAVLYGKVQEIKTISTSTITLSVPEAGTAVDGKEFAMNYRGENDMISWYISQGKSMMPAIYTAPEMDDAHLFDASKPLADNTAYYVRMNVYPNDGYRIDPDVQVILKVNGKDAELKVETYDYSETVYYFIWRFAIGNAQVEEEKIVLRPGKQDPVTEPKEGEGKDQPGAGEKKAVTAPSKVSGMKLKKAKGKKLTVKWKAIKDADGYEVCYSLDPKFKKKGKVKTKTVTKTALTLKLKKKTYHVRVRAYKLDGDKKVYGEWNKSKKIKIK